MVVELSDEVPEHQQVAVDSARLVALAQFLGQQLRLDPATELSILLVGADQMAELHEQWMDEPGPTDVLSFPMDELREPEQGAVAEPGLLGDVVLCPQVARDQAEQAGHGVDDELAILLTHGVLHLLGHDHAEPEEHAVMFGRQAELLDAWHSAGAQ